LTTGKPTSAKVGTFGSDATRFGAETTGASGFTSDTCVGASSSSVREFRSVLASDAAGGLRHASSRSPSGTTPSPSTLGMAA